MSKLGNILAAILLIALVGGILWQNQKLGQLRTEIAALRVQAGGVPPLQEEHDHLTKQLKDVTGLSAGEPEELLKLRAQAGTMPRIKRQNAMLQIEVDRAAKEAAGVPGADDAMNQMWYDSNFGDRGKDERARTHFAMRWGWAVLDYAKTHGGQFPANLREASPFLDTYRYNDQPLSADEKAQTIASADQFDLLYHGNLSAMTNSPPDGIVIIRQAQPVATINGGWARFYVNGGGGGRHEFSSNGNFDDFERFRMPHSDGQ